jgi:hypothetical protein
VCTFESICTHRSLSATSYDRLRNYELMQRTCAVRALPATPCERFCVSGIHRSSCQLCQRYDDRNCFSHVQNYLRMNARDSKVSRLCWDHDLRGAISMNSLIGALTVHRAQALSRCRALSEFTLVISALHTQQERRKKGVTITLNPLSPKQTE